MKKKINIFDTELKLIITLACLLFSPILCAQHTKESTIHGKFQLSGDVVYFPLTIVNSYPFISGEINGVKGRFMFDTGHQGALSINNNIVPLTTQKEIGGGYVGTGQKFRRYTIDSVEKVLLVNGLHFQNLKQTPSANYDFLQNGITPDYLGFIGHDFFTGYIFKLDYIKRKLTFFKNTPERADSKDFLDGEIVVAILDFETRKLPNFPMIKVEVDDVKMLASFDTGGSYGSLEITDRDAEKLTIKEALVDYGKDGADDNLYSLNKVKVSPQLTVNLIGIYKDTTDFDSPARKALGVIEDNDLTFAYRFLAQYKTVWDYENKKIYVLEY
ncbi:hypothetical protein [Algoriphagus sp.]|uniref:hypothetical protein n=1 Tax=Algoriphagus sp. TaxID=1872435 RepID=UPI003F712E54